MIVIEAKAANWGLGEIMDKKKEKEKKSGKVWREQATTDKTGTSDT